MIESNSNSQIKNIIKLVNSSRERRKQHSCIVEGPKMVIEALETYNVSKIYISQQFFQAIDNNESSVAGNNRLAGVSPDAVMQKIYDTEYEIVKDSVFNELSDTVNPQGILAIVDIKETDMNSVLSAGFGITHCCNETAYRNIKRYLILEDLQDPGNLGTIFRTAEAAGYNGILMNKGTVDAYNPKVIRSTMGAIFRVPFVQCNSTAEILSECKRMNISIYGAALNGDDIRNTEFSDSMAFIVGNESKGLTEETLCMCDKTIRIPMCGCTESLNASVASGIIMYLSNLPFI